MNDFFQLFANGHFDRTRNTIRNFKIIDSFEELYHTDCSKAQPQPENLIYPISGEIGMYEVVKTFITTQQINNAKAGEVFTYSHFLERRRATERRHKSIARSLPAGLRQRRFQRNP